MNTINIDRLTMVEVNNDFCLTSETIAATTGITNFPNIVATITTSIQVVKSYNELGSTPIGGITINVKTSRRLMMESAYRLANGTYSYASSPAVDDPDLQVQSYITINSLERLSKQKCYEKCDAIHTLANANAAGILNYGVSAADLTNANSLNNIYFAKINKTKAAVNIRKNAKKQANITLNNIIKIQLAKQLDPAANTLRFTNPEWGSQYQDSREIINLGQGTTRITYTLMQAANPVNAATASIVNKMVVARPRLTPYPIQISTPEGLIIHDKLGTGLFDITIEKEGYVIKVLRDNRVKLGGNLPLGIVQLEFVEIIIPIGPNETLVVFGPDSPQWAIGNTINAKNITTGTAISKLNLFNADSENSPYTGTGDTELENGHEFTSLITPTGFKPYLKLFNNSANAGVIRIRVS